MRQMCSLDMMKVLELLKIEGSTVRKVFSGKDFLKLRIYQKGRGEYDLTFRPGFVYPARKLPQSQAPSSFSMLLRKHFRNRRIESASLVGFDRIIRISFGDESIVIEAGRDFNIILESGGKVAAALEYISVRDREIRKGREYVPPPKQAPVEIWKQNKSLEAFLTLSGFSGPYAEHLSSKFGNTRTLELDFNEIAAEMESMKSMPASFLADSRTYYLIDIGKGERADISEYFMEMEKGKPEKERRNLTGTIEYQISKMERELEGIQKKIEFLEQRWNDIEEFLDRAKPGKDGMVEFEGIRLSSLKPFREQMAELYDKRKKLRRKIERAREVLGKGKAEAARSRKKPEKKEKRKWYHRFRYFEFPGRVFVLGKDAATNEEIIKKYARLSPVVAHSSMPGSPFGIIVPVEDYAPGEEDFVYLCQLVSCYSSSWKQGIGSSEAYWVLPDQVSKKAPSGEYLAKGSFMIYGKKNIIRTELRLGFGNSGGRLVVGPPELVGNHANKKVEITPGPMPAKDLAVLIRNRIGRDIPRDEIERRIPYGTGELSE